MTEKDLITRIRAGDRRALARALTLAENRRPEARPILAALTPHAGTAMVLGLTGSAGVGKSTLADALAASASRRGRQVAVLAVDPTSPFTGGALLGDRARMASGTRSSDVFIRSMATRGHVGGLASAVFEAIVLIEASGKDFILLETVGAGQDEVEVAAVAGLTLVIMAPGLGDELQASKAGLAEIADVFVVNKADREGADRLVEELAASRRGFRHTPPVLKTVATQGEGVEELLDVALGLVDSVKLSRRRFVNRWLREVVHQLIDEKVPAQAWDEAVDAVLSHSTDPFEAAEKLLKHAKAVPGETM